MGDIMKRLFIILLSVIILVLTGCGKSGDNKNEEVVLDINSTEECDKKLNKLMQYYQFFE